MFRFRLAVLGFVVFTVIAQAQPAAERLGDSLPEGAAARLGSVRFRHGHQISALAFTADGKTLVTAGFDNAVRIWDVAEGKLLQTFTAVADPPPPGGPPRAFTSLTVSPDGKLVAASGNDQMLRVWEVATGKPLHQVQVPGLAGLTFSPDGKRLAGGRSDRKVYVWEAETGKQVAQFTGHTGLITRTAFSRDGKILASAGSDQSVRLWDVAAGKDLHTLGGHPFAVQALAFSADGKQLATAAGGTPNPVVKIWDPATGKELKKLDGDLQGTAGLAFLDDGKELAAIAAMEGRVRVWDVQTAQMKRQFDLPPGRVFSAELTPDGKTLAVGGTHNAVLFFDPMTGKETRNPSGHVGPVRFVAIAAEDRSPITASDDRSLRRWKGDKETGRFDVKGSLLSISADGAVAAAGDADGTVRLFDAAGKELRSFKAGDGPPFAGALSADGKLIAVASSAGPVTLWDSGRGEQLRTLEGRQGVVRALGVSNDGTTLATLEPDNTLRLWSTATGRERRRIEEVLPQGVRIAFSPDARLLAVGGTDGAVRIFETMTGKKAWQFNGHNGQVLAVAFAPDGGTLAAGQWGGVRLWDLASGKERGQFRGHLGDVLGLAFAIGGATLVSAGADTTALVWDVSKAPAAAAVEVKTNDLDRLWNDLAALEATTAMPAVWALASSPKVGVLFLVEKLQPTGGIDEKRLERLVADLESAKVESARQAMTELERFGRQAEAALKQGLKKVTDVDAKLRIHVLLARLEGSSPTAEALRTLRAVQALELAATAAARAHLAKLASGAADADLTREARAAHQRLVHRGNTP